MSRFSAIVVFVVSSYAFSFFAVAPGVASVMSSVSYQWNFQGYDGFGNPYSLPPKTGSQSAAGSVDLPLSPYTPFTNVPFEASADAHVDLSVGADLGASAGAGNQLDPVLTQYSLTTATATFSDIAHLTNLPTGFVITPAGSGTVQKLVFYSVVDGAFNPSAANSFLSGYVSASVSLQIGPIASSYAAGTISYNDHAPLSVSGFQDTTLGGLAFSTALLTTSVPLTLVSSNASVDYTLSLAAHAEAYAPGYGSSGTPLYGNTAIYSDAGNTMQLSSVLVQLSDGSLVTPESLGATLTFDSGIPSPNVPGSAAVPEPVSLAIWSVLAVFVLGTAFWRTRGRGLRPTFSTMAVAN